MKIGMDISALPCPTFIKSSIENLAAHNHRLYIFTQVKGSFQFNNKDIYIYQRPFKVFSTLVCFIGNVLKLLVKSPNRVFSIWNHYKKLNIYSQIKEFNRIAPFYIQTLDVIHIQWLKSIVKLEYLIENKPCPIVVSVRGTQLFVSPINDSQIDQKYAALLPKVDAIHVVSDALKKEVSRYKNEHIYTINAAIDTDLFTYEGVKKDETSSLQIVTVTRFNWIKGLNILLDALYILKQKGVKATLTIVSSDKPTEDFIYQQATLSLTEEIVIKSNLSSAQVFDELKNHQLFVLPSLSEGRSNAILEAMAVGVPVLCSNFAGANELIEDKKNGMFFNTGDASDLAEKIELYMNMSLLEKENISKQARHTIEHLYQLKNQTSDFINLYQQLVSK